MHRFVVLRHDYPFLHWDLMLEEGESLRTWRLHEPPNSSGPITAEALPAHRPKYLDYEGPVSRNRGEVRRWDAGTYRLLSESEAQLAVQLNGRKLNGTARVLRRETPPNCQFHFVAD